MVLLPRRDARGMARSSPPVPVPVAHSPASRLQRLIRDRDAGESVVTFHQPLESISTLKRSSKGHDDLLNPWCANPMYGSTPVQIPFSKQTNPNLVVSREEATSGNTAPRWTNPKGNKRKKTSAVIGCKSKGKRRLSRPDDWFVSGKWTVTLRQRGEKEGCFAGWRSGGSGARRMEARNNRMDDGVSTGHLFPFHRVVGDQGVLIFLR